MGSKETTKIQREIINIYGIKDCEVIFTLISNENKRLTNIYNHPSAVIIKQKIDPLTKVINYERFKAGEIEDVEFALSLVSLIDFLPLVEIAQFSVRTAKRIPSIAKGAKTTIGDLIDNLASGRIRNIDEFFALERATARKGENIFFKEGKSRLESITGCFACDDPINKNKIINDNIQGGNEFARASDNAAQTATRVTPNGGRLAHKLYTITSGQNTFEAINYIKKIPLSPPEIAEEVLVTNIKKFPRTLEKIIIPNKGIYEGVIIHGTTLDSAESILKDGLKPGFRNSVIPPEGIGKKFIYSEIFNPKIERRALLPDSYGATMASRKAEKVAQHPVLLRIKTNELLKDFPNIKINVVETKYLNEIYQFMIFEESTLPLGKIPPKYLELILPLL